RAFYAPTIRELLTRMVSEHPPLPRAVNPLIPEELESVILRALSKVPEERPSNASELLHLLEQLPPLADVVPHDVASSQQGSFEQHICSLIVLRDEDGVFERATRAAEPHGLRV